MAVITAIRLKKNKKGVKVYLDGKFGFELSLEDFLKYELKVEQILSDKETLRFVKDSKLQRIYERILRFSSLRPRSRLEIEMWLKRKKVEPMKGKLLIDKLERLGLVNDKEFCLWWVEQRMQFRPRSKRMLEKELRQKGVDVKLIRRVIEDEGINEEEIVKKLIKRKEYLWKRLDKVSSKRKARDYLLRQGFNWDVVKKVVKD